MRNVLFMSEIGWLGLDLMGVTGWSVFIDDKLIDKGHFEMKQKKYIDRANAFYDYLNELHNNHYRGIIDRVAFEHAFRIPNQAVEIYHTYLTYLKRFCHENDLPLHPLNVKHIKKFASGSANADKESMVRVINVRYNLNLTYNKIDHNIADAIGVCIAADKLYRLGKLGEVK